MNADIYFSPEQERAIERLFPALRGQSLAIKKSDLLANFTQLIRDTFAAMKIPPVIEKIMLDAQGIGHNCFYVSPDSKEMHVYIENLEDGRVLHNNIMHQIGHAQDILARRFDLGLFRECARSHEEFAYLIWDIYLDGRLAHEHYFTYFQEQTRYYEYKMKLRVLARKEKEAADECFEQIWSHNGYTAADVQATFRRFY